MGRTQSKQNILDCLQKKLKRLEMIICGVHCCSEKLEELKRERAELCSLNAID